MSAQRERSAVEPNHRSIVPSIPGVPWWAAVLIAVGATALGYLLDAGHKDLTHTFALLYIAGCVAAVLAVRQAAVFTAVIQPPLILFCAVPGAYWLFHGGKVDKFKDLLINCGYPLIERFPLMLGTAGGVLLIGLVRWYFGKNSRTAPSADSATDDVPARTQARTPLLTELAAKVRALLAGLSGEEIDEAEAPPAHARGRTTRTTRPARSGTRSAQRPAARTRSRHARPDDTYAPSDERPRRTTRRSAVPSPDAGDFDPADPPRRPRRRRPDPDTDLGAPPPREARREPRTRRNPYERPYERPYDRPEPRSSRFDRYETYDRPEPPARGERRSRHERLAPEPYPPYEPPRRRTAPAGSGGGTPTHHPISQVRYRGQPPRNDPRGEPLDEPRGTGRNRPRASRRPPAEWEYDG
ncbi:DUF6542 domain-containing protein [Mycobacterium vicinigordonae]|uniref:DUF6542 domain-containing protein n=1 Tax=Mycobacterium vicinigordonae TaxID=1719132 RepID=A0A7D6HWT3_9MYCO|nr:DUF6542 domain-containing protein [Mycobacterium vicinigordonae]QLL06435.1 hypothetical protein H0P51_22215 [Mycobacterium vicinigordonae]